MGIAIVDKKTKRIVGGTDNSRKGEKFNKNLKGRNKAPRDAKPFREKYAAGGMKMDAEYKASGGMVFKGR